MKIESSKNKMMFGILGYPNSGTTLLNNILESTDNAFSLGEPLTTIQDGNEENIRLGKIQDSLLYSGSIETFIGDVFLQLYNTKYTLGCIKETYWSETSFNHKSCYKYLVNSDYIDGIFFVFRNPLYAYNRFKLKHRTSKWERLNLNEFMEDYVGNFELYNNYPKIKSSIIYEDLCCNNPIKYLNSRISSFQIIGDFNLKKTGFLYENNTANNSTKINAANNNTDCLSLKDIRKITKKLMPIYNQVRIGR